MYARFRTLQAYAKVLCKCTLEYSANIGYSTLQRHNGELCKRRLKYSASVFVGNIFLPKLFSKRKAKCFSVRLKKTPKETGLLKNTLRSQYKIKMVLVTEDLAKGFDQPKTKQLQLKITSGRIYIFYM